MQSTSGLTASEFKQIQLEGFGRALVPQAPPQVIQITKATLEPVSRFGTPLRAGVGIDKTSVRIWLSVTFPDLLLHASCSVFRMDPSMAVGESEGVGRSGALT